MLSEDARDRQTRANDSFVSHNMSAVRSICKEALILEQGKVVAQGEIDQTVDQYLSRIMHVTGLDRSY